MCLESASNTWIFLMVRIHGSGNQTLETGEAPLSVTPGEALPRCLLSVSLTICIVGLEVLGPKEGRLALGDTTIPLDWS